MLTLRTACAALILIGLGASIPARAQKTHFFFTDVVTGVQDPFHVLDGSVQAGQSFRGSYTFNLSTPNSLGSDPTTGIYQYSGAPYGFKSLMLGDYTLSSRSSNSQFEIDVLNNDPLVGDAYTVQDGEFHVSGGFFNMVEGSLIHLTDSTGTAFASDALPATPPDLSKFNGNAAEIAFRSLNGTACVDVKTVRLTSVPEGSSLAILCCLALTFGVFYRRFMVRSH